VLRVARTVGCMGHETEAKVDPPKKTGGLGAVIAFAVVFLCLGGFALKAVFGGDRASSTGDAVVACEGFVKDRLKAPSSAKFSGEDAQQSGSVYTVTGAVDSQNSFGALLRSSYTCVVEDSGSQWKLQSLTGLS
jgi:hypothetical protein